MILGVRKNAPVGTPSTDDSRKFSPAGAAGTSGARTPLIFLGIQGQVVLEQLQAFLAVNLCHVSVEFVAAAEDAVELVVAEAYHAVVGDVAAIVDLVDIGPHASAQAHVAGLSGGIELAAAQVESAKAAAGVAYGRHLAVAGGVVVAQDAVVAAPYYFSIFYYHGAEGASVPVLYAFTRFAYSEFHVFVHRPNVLYKYKLFNVIDLFCSKLHRP